MPLWKMPEKLMRPLFGLLVLLLAAALSMLIPPMQSPDENSHIARAYLIAQGQVLLQAVPGSHPKSNDDSDMAGYLERARISGGRSGGLIDLGLLQFIDGYMAFAGQPAKRISSAQQQSLASLTWSDSRQFYLMPGTGYYFPAIYMPQVLGIGIGQALGLSIGHSYQLARGFSLLACFAVLWMAFRTLTPNPLVAALLLLPMSLFQLVSPTLDGLSNCLTVLAVSLFLRALQPGRAPSLATSWGLALCIFLLSTSRTHLLPLLTLPFFLAWRGRSRWDFLLGCGVAAAAMGWTLLALAAVSDVRVVRDQSTADLLLFYLADPGAFFRVVWASLADPDWFTYVAQSFIGILGWLDTWLPGIFYPVLWVGLGLCGLASVSMSSWRQDWRARLLLAGVALACAGLVFLALLVTWTPHPAVLVHGVQGRYFVAPALLLAFALSGLAADLAPARRWRNTLLLAGFALASLVALATTLHGRFHVL
ncbi:MAG: DUF2142 domain-containing protein [Rhodoferax sp.]|nr:DUF2142 domain-containing protein [Rhodoferax sp.]